MARVPVAVNTRRFEVKRILARSLLMECRSLASVLASLSACLTGINCSSGRFGRFVMSSLSGSVIGFYGLELGKEYRADLHGMLRRVRVNVHAVRSFVHNLQRVEHLVSAGGHGASPS